MARYVAICCDWLIGYTFFSFPCFYVGHVLVTVATVATMAAAATRSRIGSVIQRLAEILPELKEMQVEQRHRSGRGVAVLFISVIKNAM